MKVYWVITLFMNIAGAMISFSNFVSPKGNMLHLLLLVLNIVGTFISHQVLQGIKNADKDQETK